MKLNLSSLNPFKYFKPSYKEEDLRMTGSFLGKKAYAPPPKGFERIENTYLERSYSLSREGGKLSLKRKWSVVQTNHPVASKAWSAVKKLFGVKTIRGNDAIAILDAGLHTYGQPNFSRRYNFKNQREDDIKLFQERIDDFSNTLKGNYLKSPLSKYDDYFRGQNLLEAEKAYSRLDQYV